MQFELIFYFVCVIFKYNGVWKAIAALSHNIFCFFIDFGAVFTYNINEPKGSFGCSAAHIPSAER